MQVDGLELSAACLAEEAEGDHSKTLPAVSQAGSLAHASVTGSLLYPELYRVLLAQIEGCLPLWQRPVSSL